MSEARRIGTSSKGNLCASPASTRVVSAAHFMASLSPRGLFRVRVAVRVITNWISLLIQRPAVSSGASREAHREWITRTGEEVLRSSERWRFSSERFSLEKFAPASASAAACIMKMWIMRLCRSGQHRFSIKIKTFKTFLVIKNGRNFHTRPETNKKAKNN